MTSGDWHYLFIFFGIMWIGIGLWLIVRARIARKRQRLLKKKRKHKKRPKYEQQPKR